MSLFVVSVFTEVLMGAKRMHLWILQIFRIFLTYNYFLLPKGASVIRMMGNFLGSEGFTTGLESYLNKFAFGNADSFDLFECLAEVSYKGSRIKYPKP